MNNTPKILKDFYLNKHTVDRFGVFQTFMDFQAQP